MGGGGERGGGGMTTSLNHRGTGPVNSDSFIILHIKGTKSSKYVFNQVVGMGSRTQLLRAESHISLLVTLAQSHKVHCQQKSEMWECNQQVVNHVHCEHIQSFFVKDRTEPSGSSDSGISLGKIEICCIQFAVFELFK